MFKVPGGLIFGIFFFQMNSDTLLIKECLNHLIALTHIEPQGFISRNRFSSNLGTFSSNLYIFAIVE